MWKINLKVANLTAGENSVGANRFSQQLLSCLEHWVDNIERKLLWRERTKLCARISATKPI
jgi:hypothetical protein